MKIITLFKSFLALGTVTAGITSAVVFSNINNVPAPYVKVLTKDNYRAISVAQNNASIVNINYATLPTSNKTIVDLLTTNDPNNQAFMFTVGSQAYANTNLLLNGINKDWDVGGNTDSIAPNSSLMLRLYELYFSDNNEDLANLNMAFYNYIDVVATKEYKNAENTLTQRRTVEGDLPPDITSSENVDSRQWKVLNDKGRWDPTSPDLQPVVKDGSKFNYYPTPEAFYEYRKDNKHDTEYEKVYYRNDAQTKEFVDSTAWMMSYGTNQIQASFAREGSLVCAKYNDTDKKWEFQSFSSASDFELVDKTLATIKEFYTN